MIRFDRPRVTDARTDRGLRGNFLGARRYDIVVIGDLRFPGGTASGAAEQIRAQAKASYRTALIHLKGPVLKYPHPFNPNIRRCIDEGLAELVDPDVAIEAPLALAYHPQIFTHLPHRPLRVTAETKLLVINHPLVDGYGEPFYDWAAINANVQESLGGGVEWAPVGPLVRAPVAGLADAPPLFPDDWLEVLDLDEWRAERQGFVGARPVIGRHSRPDPLKWPDDARDVLAAYPDDPACRVRILGGGPFLSNLVGAIPSNWEVLPFNALQPKAFLETIDFFVYFHNSRWVEAFGLAAVEAMASGTVCVLPPHFELLFGDAAVYGRATDVKDIVARHYEDFSASRAQTEKADALVRERFSHQAHARRIRALIGPPRAEAAPAATAAPEAPAAPRRVLFVTSNGVGMGHLTRMLAIARRCAGDIQPVFATMSQARKVVEDQGYLAEYIPFHGYLKCDLVSWNHFLRHELNEMISFYDAPVLVFDGNVAYGGLIGALNDHPACLGVWCRRALWRPGAQAEENIRRETAFHAVLEPGEIAAAYDAGLTTEFRDKTRLVDPIRLLDAGEMLSHEEARAELGLDPERPAALVQLGSGNNYDYDEVRKLTLARLIEDRDTQVVVAEWLISDDPVPLPDSVKRISLYPIGRYLNAFDFAVSAAGYNGFHELLDAGVPTVFVPNENPMMDEQVVRAEFAARNGLGLCARTREPYRIGPHLERMMDDAFRAEVRARCAERARPNGASEAATFVGELTRTLRGDRSPREFWTRDPGPTPSRLRP